MLNRLKTLPAAIGQSLRQLTPQSAALRRHVPLLLGATVVGLVAFGLASHPPLQTVARGEVLVRVNQFSGAASEFREGSLLVLPGLHAVRSFPLRDQSYRPAQLASASGPAPLQSVEGLSLGMDLTVRYGLDGSRLAQLARNLPDDIDRDIVEPAVQGIVYKLIARHTVREIFSSQRAEIQQALESELRAKLAGDGLLLRSVQIGKVDLPADYRRGMDGLLAESLATEKMRYTLEIKDKLVRQTELEAAADKVRRETAAEAAGREQIIAARAQEEAMKHVLPFKQRQIEQRQLEAEAERVARVKMAEGSAQARQIEAQGEAAARQKLADAEAYRVAQVGKVNAAQMATEGALITRHPLLIQKALADKLSDKIQVIIAPPPAAGGFIGSHLLGTARSQTGADGEAAATKTEE